MPVLYLRLMLDLIISSLFDGDDERYFFLPELHISPMLFLGDFIDFLTFSCHFSGYAGASTKSTYGPLRTDVFILGYLKLDCLMDLLFLTWIDFFIGSYISCSDTISIFCFLNEGD